MLRPMLQRHRAANWRGNAGLATIALGLFLVLGADQASATDRYVTPDGRGTICAQAFPCSLVVGIGGAARGDTVHVAGDLGPYPTIATSLLVAPGVSVVGEGAQVPQIVVEATGSYGMGVFPGSSITRLSLSDSAGASPPLLVLGGIGSQLRVESQESVPVQLLDGALLRDSFVQAVAESRGVDLLSGSATATLRNVTAVAKAGTASAIYVATPGSPEPGTCTSGETKLVLRNVIARGRGSDLFAKSNAVTSSEPCSATIDVGHSNYRGSAVSLEGENAALIDQGGNQTNVEPLFAADGYHQIAGSPTIDAGEDSPENGPLDIDGEPRVQHNTPDIGADEIPSSLQLLDTLKPHGLKLKFNPKFFQPLHKRLPSISTAQSSRPRRHLRHSTRVSYRLSEDARVRFTVNRFVLGIEKTFGKTHRCLVAKRARRLRRAKKCRRLVRVKGAFTHTGSQGANHFRFSGYVKGRRLRPGAYRMVGVPTDPAGNRGRRFRGSFVIVR